jgi:hypothetical protein
MQLHEQLLNKKVKLSLYANLFYRSNIQNAIINHPRLNLKQFV